MFCCIFMLYLPVGLAAWNAVSYADVKPSDPSWEDEFAAKSSKIIYSKDWQPPGGSAGAECSEAFFDLDQGKYTWPALLVDMFKVRNSSADLSVLINRNASYDSLGANGWILNSTKCGTLRKPFNAVNLATYFAVVKRLGLLPDIQAHTLQFMMAREGFGSASRAPGHLDEIWYMSEFDSENYIHMARAAGLILSE